VSDEHYLCCPECRGQLGYVVDTTETHTNQNGKWGEPPSHGESGHNVKHSLVHCVECGLGFQFNALARKGLV